MFLSVLNIFGFVWNTKKTTVSTYLLNSIRLSKCYAKPFEIICLFIK